MAAYGDNLPKNTFKQLLQKSMKFSKEDLIFPKYKPVKKYNFIFLTPPITPLLQTRDLAKSQLVKIYKSNKSLKKDHFLKN